MKTQRIALWSGPRNVSTAMMYAFAQRSDTRVMDEPLFGYFLEHTGVDRPSRTESLALYDTNAERVIREQLLGPCDTPVLFQKNMANHLEGLDFGVLEEFQNVILTRKPADVITSYIKHIDSPTLLDLSYKHQAEILSYLQSRLASTCGGFYSGTSTTRTHAQSPLPSAGFTLGAGHANMGSRCPPRRWRVGQILVPQPAQKHRICALETEKRTRTRTPAQPARYLRTLLSAAAQCPHDHTRNR